MNNLSDDEKTIIRRLLEMASDEFSLRICEDLPDDLQAIVNRHPEWTVEFHTWNGDPEVVEPGEIIYQISVLATLFAVKME